MGNRSQRKDRLAALPLTALILLSCLCAGDVSGQERYWGSLRYEPSRDVLQEALARFENAALSQAYSPELRARARSRAAEIRTRLQEGDFRVGDQFLLFVEGDSILTDTFAVGIGRMVYLPNIGEIPLEGVLRSELQEHVSDQLARFLADPVIRARPLIQIAVLGGINTPGFHRVPIETPITDVIMLAGGPKDNANLRKAHLDRYGERIWLGPELEIALREGKVLDEIRVLPGDEVIIPEKLPLSITQLFGAAGLLAGGFLGLRGIR